MKRYFSDSLIRAHSANRSWIWARKQAWTISAIVRYGIYSNLIQKRSVKRTTCSIATAVWVITAIWQHERVLFLTEKLIGGKKAYWINRTAAVIPHKGKYLYVSLTNGLMQLTVVWSGILQNDIKSLEEWKHVAISQNTLDTDILAIEDSILSQTLLTFRQRQEDIVSFIMCKSQWNLRWLSCLAREEKKIVFFESGERNNKTGTRGNWKFFLFHLLCRFSSSLLRVTPLHSMSLPLPLLAPSRPWSRPVRVSAKAIFIYKAFARKLQI